LNTLYSEYLLAVTYEKKKDHPSLIASQPLTSHATVDNNTPSLVRPFFDTFSLGSVLGLVHTYIAGKLFAGCRQTLFRVHTSH
jgi:hypothetical protein